ncbi:uncharacterized protein METZ01_LOCUS388932, partial [marine metagenome]
GCCRRPGCRRRIDVWQGGGGQGHAVGAVRGGRRPLRTRLGAARPRHRQGLRAVHERGRLPGRLRQSHRSQRCGRQPVPSCGPRGRSRFSWNRRSSAVSRGSHRGTREPGTGGGGDRTRTGSESPVGGGAPGRGGRPVPRSCGAVGPVHPAPVLLPLCTCRRRDRGVPARRVFSNRRGVPHLSARTASALRRLQSHSRGYGSCQLGTVRFPGRPVCERGVERVPRAGPASGPAAVGSAGASGGGGAGHLGTGCSPRHTSEPFSPAASGRGSALGTAGAREPRVGTGRRGQRL